MILSQNEKLYSERCRNTALSYKLILLKHISIVGSLTNNFDTSFFKAVSESFIGHKKGTKSLSRMSYIIFFLFISIRLLNSILLLFVTEMYAEVLTFTRLVCH